MATLESMEMYELVRILNECVDELARPACTPEQRSEFVTRWTAVWEEIGRRLSTDPDFFRGFLSTWKPAMTKVEVQLRRLAVVTS